MKYFSLLFNRYDSISSDILTQATEKAKSADISVVVIGENSQRFSKSRTSGENLDRMTLAPPGNQLELVKAIQKAGKPVIVVLVNGGPTASEWMVEQCHAIIEAWEPGMYGGQAIAEVIFGDYNPGAKLPKQYPVRRATYKIFIITNLQPSTGEGHISVAGSLYLNLVMDYPLLHSIMTT